MATQTPASTDQANWSIRGGSPQRGKPLAGSPTVLAVFSFLALLLLLAAVSRFGADFTRRSRPLLDVDMSRLSPKPLNQHEVKSEGGKIYVLMKV